MVRFVFFLMFISTPVERRLVDRRIILSVSDGTWGVSGHAQSGSRVLQKVCFKPEEPLTQQENLKLECLSGLSLDLRQGTTA